MPPTPASARSSPSVCCFPNMWTTCRRRWKRRRAIGFRCCRVVAARRWPGRPSARPSSSISPNTSTPSWRSTPRRGGRACSRGSCSTDSTPTWLPTDGWWGRIRPAATAPRSAAWSATILRARTRSSTATSSTTSARSARSCPTAPRPPSARSTPMPGPPGRAYPASKATSIAASTSCSGCTRRSSRATPRRTGDATAVTGSNICSTPSTPPTASFRSTGSATWPRCSAAAKAPSPSRPN